MPDDISLRDVKALARAGLLPSGSIILDTSNKEKQVYPTQSRKIIKGNIMTELEYE